MERRKGGNEGKIEEKTEIIKKKSKTKHCRASLFCGGEERNWMRRKRLCK